MKYEDLTGNLKTLYDFYCGTGKITISDGQYTLQEILDKDNDWWEFNHDFIQWVYSTDEPSKFNDNVPILTKDFVQLLVNDKHFYGTYSLKKRFDNFVETGCLEQPFNHNHLRLSRFLRFISLFEGNESSLDKLDEYYFKYAILHKDKVKSFHIWLDSTQAKFED